MKKYKVLFADLDGTLIETASGKTFPEGMWDMKIKFDVLDAIKKLAPDCVFIVSNQGGVEKGFVDEFSISCKCLYISRVVKEYCNIGCVVRAKQCISNNKTDKYRKPNTGMLESFFDEYMDKFDFDKDDALMIGDASGLEGQFSDSDKKTAENFGIDYLDVEDFVGMMNATPCFSEDK